MSSEQDSKIPVSEIPITRGSVFTRLVRIIPEQPERIPEPSLVDFLKRNRLHFGEIAGGKLQVTGVSSDGDDSKTVGRSITVEEISQVESWVEKEAPELQEDPLFHFNMDGLKPYKNIIALSGKLPPEPVL